MEILGCCQRREPGAPRDGTGQQPSIREAQRGFSHNNSGTQRLSNHISHSNYTSVGSREWQLTDPQAHTAMHMDPNSVFASSTASAPRVSAAPPASKADRPSESFPLQFWLQPPGKESQDSQQQPRGGGAQTGQQGTGLRAKTRLVLHHHDWLLEAVPDHSVVVEAAKPHHSVKMTDSKGPGRTIVPCNIQKLFVEHSSNVHIVVLSTRLIEIKSSSDVTIEFREKSFPQLIHLDNTARVVLMLAPDTKSSEVNSRITASHSTAIYLQDADNNRSELIPPELETVLKAGVTEFQPTTRVGEQSQNDPERLETSIEIV